MNRRLAGLVAVLTASALGLGGWLVAVRDEGDARASGLGARTPGGALTFTIPASWRTLECPPDEGDCVRVVAPGMAEAQAATVSFIPPNPVEGTPIDVLVNPEMTVPGSTRVTVDGLPAMRVDPDSTGQDTILVAGRARTEVGYAFMVLCPVGNDTERARDLCDQILRTLKVTR